MVFHGVAALAAVGLALQIFFGAEEEAAVAAADKPRFHALDDAFHREICVRSGLGFAWGIVRENKLESCYLRPLTWIGSEKLGVSPKGNTIHLMVAAWAWGAYLGEEGMKRGIRVKTSSYTRHHVNITMTQAKAVSNYSNSILANMEALDDGYDEALLLDTSGFVSEGAGENVFVIKDGVVYTPDLSAGALNGITRNTVLHICDDLGIKLVQKRITRDECYIADEMFFTGTAAEVTPIRELDRVQIGIGERGPVTEKIQSAFFDIVNGRNPKYAHWLTKV